MRHAWYIGTVFSVVILVIIGSMSTDHRMMAMALFTATVSYSLIYYSGIVVKTWNDVFYDRIDLEVSQIFKIIFKATLLPIIPLTGYFFIPLPLMVTINWIVYLYYIYEGSISSKNHSGYDII